MNEQKKYMTRALELAALGCGKTSPNPMVGAVIVKDGKIVGEGWHQKAGTPHAEIHALTMAGPLACQADVYVNLEPCSHFGKTPPCADALIAAGVKNVFVAVCDPNPLVAGRGLAKLKAAGIKTEVGLLEVEAKKLNEIFFKNMQKNMPFVALKAAVSLDGKTATASGSSQWITGSAARARGHLLRHEYDAVLTGIGTVIADNPQLTVRLAGEWQQPTRVVFDEDFSIPLESKILDIFVAPTLVYVAKPNAEKEKLLAAKGVKVVLCPGPDGRVDVIKALKDMYERGICSVLVEAGGTLNASLLEAGLIDKTYVFMAAKLVGGKQAPGIFGGIGINKIDEAWLIKDLTLEKIEEDWLFAGYPYRG